jgi:hypothetical protein
VQVVRRTFNQSIVALTLSIASVLGSSAAHAAVTFHTTNGTFTPALGVAGITDANILFNEAGLLASGPVVQGNSNTTPTFVVDFTGDVNLTTPAMGQARIEAQSGGTFTDLCISLNDPNAFFKSLSFEIMPHPVDGVRGNTTLGIDVVTLTGSNLNLTNYNLPIGNAGLTFFGVIADGNSTLKSVWLTGDVLIDDVRQVRIGGLGMDGNTPPPAETPEPATMALLGLGAAPLIGRLRRRTA